MAFRSVSCLFNAAKSVTNKPLMLKQCNAATAAVIQVQKATLRSTGGEPMDRPKPWPYKDISYFSLAHAWDTTVNRMNENSKIIVVEGNIATNKTEFAKRLAKEFDLKYYADVKEDDIFWEEANQHDMRIANAVLPEGARFVDTETFYTHPHPEKLGFIRTQVGLTVARQNIFFESSNHLMNTGQGVVLDRSPYSGEVYAQVLYRFGYASKQAYKYCCDVQNYLLQNRLWKPHVFIYLGAPASWIQEEIKKRGIPYEVGSKVLTNDYINALDEEYRKFLEQKVKPYSEVLVYDAHDLPDWDVVVGDLEHLNLEPPIIDEPHKFEDWNHELYHPWNRYRTYLSHGPSICDQWSLECKAPKCWEFEGTEIHYRTVQHFFSQLQTIRSSS